MPTERLVMLDTKKAIFYRYKRFNPKKEIGTQKIKKTPFGQEVSVI